MSPRGAETNPMRVALLTLLLPLYVSVGFAANYIGAFHAPKPHNVKVAVVGPPTETAPLARELSARAKGAFTISQLTSIGRAQELVGERKLDGAYVPGTRRPTLVVATAAGPSLANVVEATFRQVAAAQDRVLAIDDVRPLPPGNGAETPNFFFLIICTFGAFLVVAALGLAVPTLPEHRRVAVVLAASILAPVVAYLIGGPGYGTFGGPFGTIIAMLGMGALYAFTVAGITRLMQVGLGPLGLLVGSLVFIFLNLPSSGGTVAPQLLPGFWRFLNHFWIGAAGLDANRSILYFGGAGVGIDVLKIFAWYAAWAALLAVPIYLRIKRRRERAAPAAPAVGLQPES